MPRAAAPKTQSTDAALGDIFRQLYRLRKEVELPDKAETVISICLGQARAALERTTSAGLLEGCPPGVPAKGRARRGAGAGTGATS